MKVSFLKIFKEKASVYLLLAATAVFSLLRLPSLIEPNWYGDEGIYQVIGRAIMEGRPLYEGIWDNKPPLLYLTYALLNGDMFSLRLLSLIFGVLALIFLFLLAKQLFQSRTALYLTLGSFALLFGLPLLEGNIANAENFMLAPIILAGFLVTLKPTRYRLILAGLLLSIAFLTKIVALFDFVAFFLYLIVLRTSFNFSSLKELNLKRIKGGLFGISNEILFCLAFIFPIVLTLFYFFLNGTFSDYFQAAFSTNTGYVGYGNHFLFPNGLLFLKIALLAFALLLIIRFQRRIGKNGLFIFIWLSLAVFNALFSQRPYTHYLLVLLPSFSLLLGFLAERRDLIILNGVALVGLGIIAINGFNLYGKIFPYYQNYLNFVFYKTSVEDYQAFFDQATPRDYEIADFIRRNTKAEDQIFLWGDNGQIYTLSNKLPPGRYIVAYHITFYEKGLLETQQAVNRSQPKYIITTKEESPIQPLLESYELKTKIKDAKIYLRK
jgi:hypothetical protein